MGGSVIFVPKGGGGPCVKIIKHISKCSGPPPKCIVATRIWQLVIHSCVIFAYIIRRRDSENNSFLPGVFLPPSLLARAYSLAPQTPFPFLFKRLPGRLRKRLRFETSASTVQELPFSDESVSAQFCNLGEHVFSELESSLRDKWKQIFSTVKNQGAKKAVEGYLKKKEWIGKVKASGRSVVGLGQTIKTETRWRWLWKTAYYFNHLYSSNEMS